MIRTLVCFCLGIAVVSPTSNTSAQSTSQQAAVATSAALGQGAAQEQIERDATALTVLNQAWAVLGGSDLLTGKTISISGTADVYAGKYSSATFQLLVDSADNQSFEVADSAGNTASITLKNQELSMIRPGKTAVALPLHKALNLAPYFFPVLIHHALKDFRYSVIDKGGTLMDGVNYVTVELKRVFPLDEDRYQELSQFTDRLLYIDPMTYEVKRIAYKSYSNSSITIFSHRSLDFDSYKQFGTSSYPASITDSIDDRLISHFVVTQISAN